MRAATDGYGADLVLDAVGGPLVEQLVGGLRPGGDGDRARRALRKPTPLPAGGPHPVWLRRYHVFEITTDPAAMRRAEHFVRAGLARRRVRPR